MALSGIQRTFADILDSIWGKDAQTSIPTQPVSGIAYRDTDAEFESGQKYDSLGESSRWNQMLYLLTGLMSELTAFGILPWSAAQPYSKGALCIGFNGALWQAQIDIVPNPTNPVVPGTDSSVWASPEIPGTVPDSRLVIAGTGLTGGGALSADVTLAAKLTDSVSSTDSTTAASAKAVKTAYDLANSKQANLGFTPVQQGGGAGQEGNKIYIGWSAAGLKAQADALDLGNIVTTSAGCTKAPSAATADRLRRSDGVDTLWNWAGQPGQPPYVWGSNDGINMLVWNPANFSVAYASSAGSANMKVYAAWHSNAAAALPAGGTWIWIKYANYPDRYNYCNAGTAAGGTWIGNESGIGGNTSGVSICAFQIAA